MSSEVYDILNLKYIHYKDGAERRTNTKRKRSPLEELTFERQVIDEFFPGGVLPITWTDYVAGSGPEKVINRVRQTLHRIFVPPAIPKSAYHRAYEWSFPLNLALTCAFLPMYARPDSGVDFNMQGLDKSMGDVLDMACAVFGHAALQQMLSAVGLIRTDAIAMIGEAAEAGEVLSALDDRNSPGFQRAQSWHEDCTALVHGCEQISAYLHANQELLIEEAKQAAERGLEYRDQVGVIWRPVFEEGIWVLARRDGGSARIPFQAYATFM